MTVDNETKGAVYAARHNLRMAEDALDAIHKDPLDRVRVARTRLRYLEALEQAVNTGGMRYAPALAAAAGALVEHESPKGTLPFMSQVRMSDLFARPVTGRPGDVLFTLQTPSGPRSWVREALDRSQEAREIAEVAGELAQELVLQKSAAHRAWEAQSALLDRIRELSNRAGEAEVALAEARRELAKMAHTAEVERDRANDLLGERNAAQAEAAKLDAIVRLEKAESRNRLLEQSRLRSSLGAMVETARSVADELARCGWITWASMLRGAVERAK